MAAPQRHLSLWDSTSLIVGIIVGVVIYESVPLIAAGIPQEISLFGRAWTIPGAWGLAGVWLLGGGLSLLGAVCYAELVAADPCEGGDFVYLTRAFGRPVGFLFAWAQLWVVRPGSIGAMAFVFARYADRLYPLELASRFGGTPAAEASTSSDPASLLVYACAAVLFPSIVHLFGVRSGKGLQNVLTLAKLIGLGVITLVGLCYVAPTAGSAAASTSDGSMFGRFGLSMILVLFAYGGWNEAAYVGAEVRDPKKNISRALFLGIATVTAVYVLASTAFVHALGFRGVVESNAVGAEVLRPAFGPWADRVISVLIAVSALGAVNGQIFTGARIYYAMGTEHRWYRALGRWHPRWGTPVASLVVQAVVTLAIMIGFGINRGGFQAMVIFTTPVFWFFSALMGPAVILLRRREPAAERPYRIPFFPIPPILFCISCCFMVGSGLQYAVEHHSYEAFWSIGLLLVGAVLCAATRGSKPDEKL